MPSAPATICCFVVEKILRPAHSVFLLPSTFFEAYSSLSSQPHRQTMTAFPLDSPPESFSTNSSRFVLLSAPSALTATLCAVLESDVCASDASGHGSQDTMTVFHALEAPSISVSDYVSRVSKYVFCSEACLVTAYHYLTLAVRRHSNLSLSSLTVHRLLITAVVLACKYLDDTSYNLSYYARVGGLPSSELANLEIHMLRMLDFRLDVSVEHYAAIEASLIARVSRLAAPDVMAISPPQVASLACKARNLLDEACIPTLMPTSPLPFSDDDDAPSSKFTCYAPCSIPDSNSSDHSALPSSPVSSDAASDSLSRNSSSDSLSHAVWTSHASQPIDASHAGAAVEATSYVGRSTQPTGLLPPHGPSAVPCTRYSSYGTRTWRRDVRGPVAPNFSSSAMPTNPRTGFQGNLLPVRPVSMPVRTAPSAAMPPQPSKPMAPPRRTYHVHHHIYASQPQTSGMPGRSRSMPSALTHGYPQPSAHLSQTMPSVSNISSFSHSQHRYAQPSGHNRAFYGQGAVHPSNGFVRQSLDGYSSSQQEVYSRRGPGSTPITSIC